ncbi:DUF1724 domain-containing protein, partial [Methanobrevibacter sp. OttesenSCG-928-K11]|nr:DUF1724 domain-containing protein [Methanobrevibacter sp. OttesenSCG-928-K11]
LKLLHVIFHNECSMKQINQETSLSYSSISSNISKLEKKNLLFRKSNKYYLTNDLALYLICIFDFNNSLMFLKDFTDFFIGHNVQNIPLSSIEDLYLLKSSKIIESTGHDIYKTYNIIQNILNEGQYVKAILPFLYSNFIDILLKLIKKQIKIDLIVPKNIGFIIKKEIQSDYLNLIFTKEEINFSLFFTEDSMALGLFKNDGTYDQNRLLISNSENSIFWASRLFNNYKKELKKNI